jgi:hypothetical protein
MATEAPIAPDHDLAVLFEFAALSAGFAPKQALSLAADADREHLAELASRLAQACDTDPPNSPGEWVIRTPERRKVLRRLETGGRLGEAVKARRGQAVDPDTDEFLKALEGAGDYTLGTAERLALHPKPERGPIETMILALDRAGEIAPAYGALPLLRGALARLDRQKRLDELERNHVALRPHQGALIGQWLKTHFTKPPVQVLYAGGPPGIGKSMLLESSVQAASAGGLPILVRLDFDRPGLDVLDQLGLTAEVARQVANECGEAGRSLLTERLRTSSLSDASADALKAQRQLFPQQLAEAIGGAVAASGRDVLVILDTLEALRARGDTHPPALFRWLDRLVETGLQPVRVLAAGRDDTLPHGPSEPDRVGLKMEVEALDEESAEALMDRLEVPAPLRADIVRVAAGNPLLLRVAAEVTREGSADGLDPRQEGEVAEAFLYRILLSRIDDATLRALLSPGLILGSIDVDVLRELVAPAVDVGPLSPQEATRLFKSLCDQTWLVETDPFAPGFVRMRWPLRSAVLPLLYDSMRGACARLDRDAARWFARRPDPWFQALATYHRLQRMRVTRAPVGISAQMAMALDDKMIADLPPKAQDLVHGLRGGRTSQLRSGGSGRSPGGDDESIARELMGIIERQDWNEGHYAAQQLTGGGAIDPRSRAADALRTFWWRSGRWARARAWMLERERLGADGDARELADMPPMLALVRLEMEAEFEPRRLQRRLKDQRDLAEIALGAVQHAADDIARSGALGFVLADWMGGGFDKPGHAAVAVPGAAFAFFGRRLASGGEDDLRRALSEAHERMQARQAGGESSSFEPPVVARLLAALTPYAAMAVNLSVQPDYDWATSWASAVDARLSAAGALLPWSAQPALQERDHPILAIARLGLFAEWAQAAAMFHGCPDLRLIGRSADAWRRTAAGEWRYGRRPGGWPARVTDVTLEHRFDRLCESDDPRQAALEQLALWTPSGNPDGAAIWARIGRGPVRADANPLEEMRRLLRNRVPSSFVPAAAVLGTRPG